MTPSRAETPKLKKRWKVEAGKKYIAIFDKNGNGVDVQPLSKERNE